MKHYDFTINVVGSSLSGKKSLISRYCDENFSREDPETFNTEALRRVEFEGEEYEVLVQFEFQDVDYGSYSIIVVDLRKSQVEVNYEIEKFVRQQSFKTSQSPIIVGACADARISSLQKCEYEHKELSSFDGSSVNFFFEQILYRLVQQEVLAQREEDAFQGSNFSCSKHQNSSEQIAWQEQQDIDKDQILPLLVEEVEKKSSEIDISLKRMFEQQMAK